LRGQLASYVAALTGSQFRIHVFTILIFGRRARLMFWDRNGAVVSRPFDYTSTNYLEIFLQQFNKEVGRRGHDTSVTIAEPSLLREVPQVHQADLQRNERHRDFRVMTIPDRDNASESSGFLISYPPKYTSRSPFGRATRPMVVRLAGISPCIRQRLLETCYIGQGGRYLQHSRGTQGEAHRHVWQRERHSRQCRCYGQA
jgi:hypothetical protein